MNFETSLRTAQAFDFQGGALNANGAAGGPQALASQPFFIGINDSFPPSFGFNPTGAPFNAAIFNLFSAWAKLVVFRLAPAWRAGRRFQHQADRHHGRRGH